MSDPGRDSSAHLLPSELIDWPKRLAKEQPLISRVLAEAPSKRVLDLGCGTGQHARFLADQGWEVVAIDASEDALERAQKETVPAGVQFLLGDMGAVERSVRGHLGAALCLGNTLPHLLSPESLSRMLVGLKRRLLPGAPGAPFLFQVLNYDRIFAGAERALPLELLPSPRGELIVVRLVQPRQDGMVLHTTSTLRYRPTADPVMEVVDTRTTQLRGWKRAELEIMLEVARLSTREVYGDMAAAPYDPDESLELVMVVG